MRLFVGDDWAEDHHDVELMDPAGRVLAKRRLPEGVAGMARLHEMIGQQLGEADQDAEVAIGIETDRGPWVLALVAAGYTVFGVNPLQASRYRERHGVSGAKSDGADARMLTDMVRTDSHQLRAAALKRARRRGIPDKATAILAALRSPQLGQPSAVTAAYAATVRSLIAVITTLNEQGGRQSSLLRKRFTSSLS